MEHLKHYLSEMAFGLLAMGHFVAPEIPTLVSILAAIWYVANLADWAAQKRRRRRPKSRDRDI